MHFFSVLSRVNKGRVAGLRALRLLERAALKSEQNVQRVAKILKRLSATAAIMDRGRLIDIRRSVNSTRDTAEAHSGRSSGVAGAT